MHSVGGDLDISNDTKLASLHGLENLSHVGGVLTLHDNPKLPACLASQLSAQVANSYDNCIGNDTTGPGSLDGDGDGTCNLLDGCPSDASKIPRPACAAAASAMRTATQTARPTAMTRARAMPARLQRACVAAVSAMQMATAMDAHLQ